ncbi:MAG: hypothetical protein GY856_53925 [bacterium]|nr:hypothetical protein [bacterium]
MIVLAVIFGLGILVCPAVGVQLHRRLHGRPIEERLVASLIPLALFCLFLLYFSRIGFMLHRHWDSARVAPSVALTCGYDLYYGAESGPIMTTHYGPVKALLYLPAALASTPTAAIMIAGTLNVLIVLVPLLLFHLRGNWAEPPARTIGLAGFVFSASALLIAEPTRMMVTRVHVDAPAVGLGLLSCFLLLVPGERPNRRRLASAAACAVLATWSKQIEVPLILAQAAFLGWACGRRVMWSYIAWSALLGAVVSASFLAVFGLENMRFNLVTLPSRILGHGDWTEFSAGFLELLTRSSFLLLILFLALRRIQRSPAGGERRPIFATPWALPVTVAVFLAPTSVLSRVIHGGDPNSYHSFFYLLVAASLILTHFEVTGSSGHRRRNGARVLFLLAAGALCLAPELALPRHLFPLRDNPQQEAYEFARKHPEEAFFPWNPLSTLLADGKLYHFDYTMNFRKVAGFSPSDAHVREHVPRRIRYVIYHRSYYQKSALQFLPEFTHEQSLDELPDWIVTTRAPGESAGGARPTGPGSGAR